ncbi:hypothetical protein I4J42_05040 [Corynebacterium belfantii]|uniref:hypothetical protein n=1 Tax=Corynebacterium belfantii TaxID=2014537 RepID=UPI0018D33306|nr:hypothetical protein [Corynebacterium belfantii]MBG9333234.1 hypothetical protein [Corynebacterium belfantii]
MLPVRAEYAERIRVTVGEAGQRRELLAVNVEPKLQWDGRGGRCGLTASGWVGGMSVVGAHGWTLLQVQVFS